jgi:hypothetical protein
VAFDLRFSTVFRAQTVSVAFEGTTVPIPAGSSRQFAVSVKNHGAVAATYALSATTDLGTVRDLSASTILLSPGGSATASFYIDVPSDAAAHARIRTQFRATDIADPARYNAASARLYVAGQDDLDGDQFLNGADNCPNTPDTVPTDSRFRLRTLRFRAVRSPSSTRTAVLLRRCRSVFPELRSLTGRCLRLALTAFSSIPRLRTQAS